jgi:tRNA A-37 threonylcarbamoyl transferase component Bud32
MTQYEPKYEKDEKFRNRKTDEEFMIIGMMYDNTLCDIVYKVRHLRFKFNMRKIPETVLQKNLERGNYEKK